MSGRVAVFLTWLNPKLSNVFSDLRLEAINGDQVLRVGQVESCCLKLGPMNILLQIYLRWLNKPQVLVLMGHFLVDERHRGWVPVRFLQTHCIDIKRRC